MLTRLKLSESPNVQDSSLAIPPINLISTLQSILAGQDFQISSIILSNLTTSLSITPSNFYGPISPLAKTSQILNIYSSLSPSSGITNSVIRAQNAVLKIDELGWTLEDIGRLAFGIALPLREALRLCQLEAPENWRPSAYELISRPDLAKQIGGTSDTVQNVS